MNLGNPRGILFSTSLIYSLIFTNTLTAQDSISSKKSDFWQHVRFGGGLGLSSSNNFFTLSVSPSAIYDFHDQLSLGIGINYTFNDYKNRYTSNIYGGSIIGLFNPFKQIQISAEFEQLYVNRKYEGILRDLKNDNYFSPAIFLGIGYQTQFVTIGARYNLLFNNEKSVYADAIVPFVRIYF